MKTYAIRLSAILAIHLFIVPGLVFGQISITQGSAVTPEDLVEKIVGPGIQYDNITYQGASNARGIFSNGAATNLGFDQGIFLTSGSGDIIPGPNQSCSAGVNNGQPGNATLNTITTSVTYDASVLEFDFVSIADTVQFKYVFGSEDYNEGVGTSFNDVFGCFVTGPNPLGGNFYDKNIAIVPGTVNTTVKVNNVNNGYKQCGVVPTGPCTHCAYFTDNTNGLTLEYDGKTTVLVAFLIVVPCETYHIKIGIADDGDGIVDSGVFIEENSFTSPQPEISTQTYLDPPGYSQHMVEGHVVSDLVFRLPDSSYTPIAITWDLSESTADPSIYPPGDFDGDIPDHVILNAGQDSAVLHIAPVQDGIVEGDEHLIFIIENNLACFPSYDTLDLVIEDYNALTDTISPQTITCEGYEMTLWVDVDNGYPPYTYSWEPGGFTTDSITVSPDTTTTYVVTYADLFGETGKDSTKLTVIPVCDFETYYFEASLNPGLPTDIFGELLDDTVSVVFPAGTDLSGLIASFTTEEEGCLPGVNGVVQVSGVTINDFTDTVVYQFFGPGGCPSQWVVIADIGTGKVENSTHSITVFPNPASDQLMVQNAKGWELIILNSIGKPVLNGQIADNSLTINISHLEPGLYFLKFQKMDELFVKRVMICR